MLSVDLTRVAWVAALATALLLLAWQLAQLPLPFQFDYVEGMMLHGVGVAASGHSLYPKIGGLPILITAYPPLYYYLCAAGNLLFGHSFFFGRLVSLVSVLATAAAVGWMVRRRTGLWPPVVLAAAFFYLTIPARNWAVLMRVDALEVALAVGGFYAAMVLGRRHLAALLFLASFLTKHTMFAAPAAVLLAWWLEGRRREAAVLAGTLAGVAGGIFALLGWRTGGDSYIYLFGIHGDPVLLDKWLREILFLSRTIPVVLALALWLAIDEARRWWRARAEAPAAPDPVVLYLATAFLSTLLGSKLASFWNHYLEFCAVACLAAGCAVARLAGWARLAREESVRPLLGTALALQWVLLLPLAMPWSPGRWFHGASALALAAAAGWCAYRAHPREQPSRWWAAVAAGVTVLAFPGVWHWGLMMMNLWPALLSLAALALLIEGQAELAGATALAAIASAGSLLPITVPVAWVLVARPRRYGGLLFIALALATTALVSPEPNPFHSPRSLPLTAATLQYWLPAVALLVVLAIGAAVAARGRTPLFLPVYAAAALVFALAFQDGGLWVNLGPALAILASGIAGMAGTGRFRGREAVPVLAPAALLVQLALLSPFELWLQPGYDAAQLRYVYATVAAAPDPVIAENVGLLSAARKPVLVSDPFACRLSPKYFPEEPLLEKLGKREIALAVLARDPTSRDFPTGDTDRVWSRRFVEVLKLNYRKSREYDIGGEKFFFFSPVGPKVSRAVTGQRASGPVHGGDPPRFPGE